MTKINNLQKGKEKVALTINRKRKHGSLKNNQMVNNNKNKIIINREDPKEDHKNLNNNSKEKKAQHSLRLNNRKLNRKLLNKLNNKDKKVLKEHNNSILFYKKENT
jgi:hypothetical protein